MNKLFYPKLAGQNIIKNGKFYFPYLLTVVISAAAFYIMTALSYYNDLPGNQRYDYLMMFMTLGSVVLALFIVIFLSYTNSFLMKRRSKELGLYNILGMGKSSIGIVLCWESLYTWLCGIVIGISGMLHRMNRNAVGLANICILSTMVLVMISSTLSLYMGTEDSIRLRYPADISGVFIYNEDDNFDTARLTDGMTKAVRAQGLEPTKIWSYNSMPLFMVENNNELRNMNTGDANGMVVNAVMLTAADYTAISGKELTLAPDEVMYVGGDARYDTLHISIVDGNGSVERREFRTVEQDKSFKIGQYVVYAANIKYLIFPDMAALRDIWKLVEDTAAGNGPVMQMTCNICFDTDDTDEQKRKCGEAISDWDNVGPYISGDQIDWERYYVNEKTENAEGFYSMNGAFLFLGGFLGIIFMMAMVLIIYYKQISEGYEDRERYRIMQQVGLQKEEVRSSINKQVLIVFFAPLVVAAVHVAFDFSLVKLMLQLFGLMNVQLAMWCTVGSFAGFALIYALVYMRTAKVYYKIVSE